ncbi:MAG: four helix bundle protein [Verrucomicrobiota bacterium]
MQEEAGGHVMRQDLVSASASYSGSKVAQDAPRAKAAGVFDHETLDVYQLELRFVAWVTPVLDVARGHPGGGTREVCDQLDRASLSMLLNTAEGNGKRRGRMRARFFDDARGSATECAACLDAMVAKGVLPDSGIAEGKKVLLRISCMLTKLVDLFGGHMSAREERAGYDGTAEYETEAEYEGRQERADNP